jgi:hypothetical protein
MVNSVKVIQQLMEIYWTNATRDVFTRTKLIRIIILNYFEENRNNRFLRTIK